MQAEFLTFVIPSMTAVFALAFVALWWFDRERPYILALGGWFIGVAIVLSLQAWVVPNFGPVEVILFHGISAFGLLSLKWGLAKRDERRMPWAAYVVFVVASGVILWFAAVAEVQSVILMVQNYCTGVLFAFCGYDLWQRKNTHLADHALLACVLTLACYSLFRPSIVVIMQNTMTMAEYQSSGFLAVNMGVQIILCLVLASCLIAVVVADNLRREREEATQDALTGLLSRGAFEERATQMLARAHAERVPVSLLIGDIDHFKRVNDTWGHSAGDRVIAAFGNILASKIRPRDVAGRVGGEEFCVIVWNCPEKGAASLGERLRMGFASETIEDLPIDRTFTASFGVAQWERGEEYLQTFKRADAALYAAKRSGRNRVEKASGAPLPCDDEDAQAYSAYEDETGASVVPLRPLKAGS